jgi:hypothetical protein
MEGMDIEAAAKKKYPDAAKIAWFPTLDWVKDLFISHIVSDTMHTKKPVKNICQQLHTFLLVMGFAILLISNLSKAGDYLRSDAKDFLLISAENRTNYNKIDVEYPSDDKP